jgi:hypothetical protein
MMVVFPRCLRKTILCCGWLYTKEAEKEFININILRKWPGGLNFSQAEGLLRLSCSEFVEE